MSDSLIEHGSQAIVAVGVTLPSMACDWAAFFSDARWSALLNAIGSGPAVGSCGVGEFFLAVL